MQGRTFTDKEKEAFLKKLRSTYGNVTKAAALIGISRVTAYNHRKADSGFAEQWDEAIAAGGDDLEELLHKQALKGVQKPVYHGGKLVGHITEFNHSLSLALLRRHKPEYRERMTQDMNLNFAELSDEELEVLARGGSL